MSAPVAAPTRSGGGGCLKGCLFGCLAPILVGAVVAVVGLMVARPYVAPRLEQFRQDNPWADVVIDALPAAGEMARNAAKSAATPDTATGGAGSRKRLGGVNDKSAMPADIPVVARPKDEIYSVGDGNVAVYQEVRGEPAPVVAHFKGAMPKQGWKLTREQRLEGTTLMVWEKGRRVCKVDVVHRGGHTTEVWIRSRALPS